MCFYIHDRYPDKRIAKRDIPCYKEGFQHKEDIFLPKYHPGYEYCLGQLNKIVCEWPIQLPAQQTYSERVEIHEGFHSYSNKKRLSQGYACVKCIIPKGAHYFYNPSDREYVSDQIVVQEFID